jgi:subtilisin family serine protease
MKRALCLLLAVIMLLFACAANPAQSAPPQTAATASEPAPATPPAFVKPFSDVRAFSAAYAAIYPELPTEFVLKDGEYSPEDIKTLTYNLNTEFQGSEELARQILKDGKNPGLGVRPLHLRGITGEGVNVAIIDQNLAQPFHPEFADRIVLYCDFGTGCPADQGSMHGVSVASLLAGQTTGVAPNANIYFAAVPSWEGDAAYYAEALRWIIEENKKLPEDNKIRLVSVSASLFGFLSSFKKNIDMWGDAVAEAQEAGILVIDCSAGRPDTGFVGVGYYDISAPDDVASFHAGFPADRGYRVNDNNILAPSSFRTMAELYIAGENAYQHYGQGGLSWAIPYAAGVLALGWQVNPELTSEEIVSLLFESAYVNEQGHKIINPPEFILSAEGLKSNHLKSDSDLRGYFSDCQEEDAGVS